MFSDNRQKYIQTSNSASHIPTSVLHRNGHKWKSPTLSPNRLRLDREIQKLPRNPQKTTTKHLFVSHVSKKGPKHWRTKEVKQAKKDRSTRTLTIAQRERCKIFFYKCIDSVKTYNRDFCSECAKYCNDWVVTLHNLCVFSLFDYCFLFDCWTFCDQGALALTVCPIFWSKFYRIFV